MPKNRKINGRCVELFQYLLSFAEYDHEIIMFVMKGDEGWTESFG